MASKCKRYYWLKLKQDFFSDPRIKKLRRIAGGDTYTVILLKLMLLTVKSNGILEYEGIESTLAMELALKMDEDDKNVEATLIYMQSMNLLIEMDERVYDIPQVRELTGSETDSAERKRRQRQREKEAKGVTMSHQGHALVTSGHKIVTTEIETEKEKEKEPLSIVSLQNFDEFVSHIRAKYINKLVINSRDKHTGTSIAISVTSSGRLYNLRNGEEFQGVRAKEIWASLFELYQKGTLILNTNKETLNEPNQSK